MAKRNNKSRTHRVVVEMVFDHHAKNCIHGEQYLSTWSDDEPGVYKVKAVTRMPSPRALT
jgi:hypothetical protein